MSSLLEDKAMGEFRVIYSYFVVILLGKYKCIVHGKFSYGAEKTPGRNRENPTKKLSELLGFGRFGVLGGLLFRSNFRRRLVDMLEGFGDLVHTG